MSLFNYGDFTLHSGQHSNLLIDCNYLSDEDLACLARLIARWNPFGAVEGVPRGGLRLAAALAPLITLSDPHILLVDDVFTTGASMTAAKAGRPLVWGAVIFARRPPPWWITPVIDLSQHHL